MELSGKVCVITGASSGIGRATSILLAEKGARVVLAARREERLASLAQELPGSLAVASDVTKGADVDRLVEEVLENFGAIDLLVNNAGQGLHVPLEEVELPDLRAVFELNVVAPLRLMQRVLPIMRSSGQGAVVNVSSATSLHLVPGLGGYAATKAALNMLSQTARVEFADQGIVVSVVYPALTATEFHQNLRGGNLVRGRTRIEPDPPELAAATVLYAAETGAAHVLVADPPQPFDPATDRSSGASLAR